MNDTSRKLNWAEVEAMAALCAEAYRRTGRNPTQMECDAMIATARHMAADGVVSVQ